MRRMRATCASCVDDFNVVFRAADLLDTTFNCAARGIDIESLSSCDGGFIKVSFNGQTVFQLKSSTNTVSDDEYKTLSSELEEFVDVSWDIVDAIKEKHRKATLFAQIKGLPPPPEYATPPGAPPV